MKYMPKMSQVITDVATDIAGHAGTTGAQVLARVNHKQHQIKQAIWRLYKAGTITPTQVNMTLKKNTKYSEDSHTLLLDTLYATKLDLISDFTGNFTITHVYVRVSNAVGNIRVKIYNGTPSTLLGQSNSTAATNGLMEIALTSSVVIAPYNSIYIAIESDDEFSGLQIIGSLDTTNTITKKVTHTYGAGPDPFGTPVASTILPYVGVKMTQNQIPRWYTAQWT